MADITLDDLRVMADVDRFGVTHRWDRPASLADLASVLAGLSDEELAEMGLVKRSDGSLHCSPCLHVTAREDPDFDMLRVDGEETG